LLGELDLSGPIWLGLHARAMWNRRNDRLFAGISASSDAALAAASYGTARYGSDIALGEVRWTRSFARRLSAILHVDLQRRDYQSSDVSGGPPVAELFGLPPGTCAAPALSNECVDPTLVPGFQNGLRILHAGAGLTWDARSRARLAGGGSISLNATYGKGVAGDPSQHVTYAGEAVLAVGWVDRAFLLRGRAAMIQALGAAPIPFDELVSPSGNGGMRAFPEGRFRGQSGVVGTAEYRWYIAHNLDASLFTDLGTVGGQDFAELFQNTWFPSFGAGIRLFLIPGQYWEGSAPTGLQVAYAPNSGFRLMLALATF
jgi:outer membrane protein assembly factor BamA